MLAMFSIGPLRVKKPAQSHSYFQLRRSTGKELRIIKSSWEGDRRNLIRFQRECQNNRLQQRCRAISEAIDVFQYTAHTWNYTFRKRHFAKLNWEVQTGTLIIAELLPPWDKWYHMNGTWLLFSRVSWWPTNLLSIQASQGNSFTKTLLRSPNYPKS